ncbi:MAG: Sapep family Mn(2+)-dependent dipeptidase [Deltaproteobacteria bacterium]|nr:Sapep family Mn(2+)-dependent dipeptidase [Deltaproteobacteria bacterium]
MNSESVYLSAVSDTQWAPQGLHDALAAQESNLITDIEALVSIPSMADMSKAEPGAPFGRPVRDALDYMTRRAKALGLRPYTDPSGAYAYADIGKGPKVILVPVHLDVMPGGDPSNWFTGDPFKFDIRTHPQTRQRAMFGRGVVDDKGPAVMVLYAAAMLVGLKLNRDVRIRIAFFSDEERGKWDVDVKSYLEKEGYPALALVPDANFPYVIERDIIATELSGLGNPLPRSVAARNGIKIESLSTGDNRQNQVPDRVTAEISAPKKSQLEELLRVLSNALHERVVFSAITRDNGSSRVTVTVKGQAVHARKAWEGINAVQILAQALTGVRMADTPSARVIHFIQTQIGYGWEGSDLLGIESMPRKTHGEQSFNIGVVDTNLEGARLVVDNRVRIQASRAETLQGWQNIAQRAGMQCKKTMELPGITPRADHPALPVLMTSVRRAFNKPMTPPIEGGGTYARAFKKPDDPDQLSIAYGPLPKGHPETEHQPNEFMGMQCFRAGLQTYLNTFHAATMGRSII